MTADVYAGDDALNTVGTADEEGLRILLIARADPDPGLLLKLATAIRVANILPQAASLVTDPAGVAIIALELQAGSATLVDLIRRKVEQIVDVHSVELLYVSPVNPATA